jgi:hypothetical protein
VVGDRPPGSDEVPALAYPAVPRRLRTLSFFPGHVEALPKHYAPDIDSIQVSMALAGGMSGGPVVRQDGGVVGIAEATFEVNEANIPSRRFNMPCRSRTCANSMPSWPGKPRRRDQTPLVGFSLTASLHLA